MDELMVFLRSEDGFRYEECAKDGGFANGYNRTIPKSEWDARQYDQSVLEDKAEAYDILTGEDGGIE